MDNGVRSFVVFLGIIGSLLMCIAGAIIMVLQKASGGCAIAIANTESCNVVTYQTMNANGDTTWAAVAGVAILGVVFIMILKGKA